MRIAALYDIHANLPALEAVLQEVREVNADLIVVGGDVLPVPFPQETIQVLLDVNIPIEFIHGNGDREVLAQIDGVESDRYLKSPESWRALAPNCGTITRRLQPCRVEITNRRGILSVMRMLCQSSINFRLADTRNLINTTCHDDPSGSKNRFIQHRPRNDF